MRRIALALFACCLCPGLLSATLDASQIPTAVAPAKKTVQKENMPAVPQAGKNGYTMPVCIHCPQPQYPGKAFREKANGDVTLSLVVRASGFPDDVRVVKSSNAEFDSISVETVRRKWLFKPALGPDGKLAAVQMTVEVTFRLY